MTQQPTDTINMRYRYLKNLAGQRFQVLKPVVIVDVTPHDANGDPIGPTLTFEQCDWDEAATWALMAAADA
jgi:hypothetical protein